MDENSKEIARLRRILTGLAKIPEHRRNDECADERMRDIVLLLQSRGDTCADVRFREIYPPA